MMRLGLLIAVLVLIGGGLFAYPTLYKASHPEQQSQVAPGSPVTSIQETAIAYSASQVKEAEVARTSALQTTDDVQPIAAEDSIETTEPPAPAIITSAEPPPMPVYVVPAPPAPDYAWTPGHWMWNGHGYYWIPGTWMAPPAPHVLWTPGYWAFSAGMYMWHAGYWGQHVGYYGGVHYGGGYNGAGFDGGEWQNDHYVVNRSVTNITNIRNDTNITNVTASFNGGPGGSEAHSTPDEERAAHEQHVMPPVEQLQHIHAASIAPSLRVMENKGNPPVKATAAPIKQPEEIPARAAEQESRLPPAVTQPAMSRPGEYGRPGEAAPRAPEPLRQPANPARAMPPVIAQPAEPRAEENTRPREAETKATEPVRQTEAPAPVALPREPVPEAHAFKQPQTRPIEPLGQAPGAERAATPLSEKNSEVVRKPLPKQLPEPMHQEPPHAATEVQQHANPAEQNAPEPRAPAQSAAPAPTHAPEAHGAPPNHPPGGQ